MGRTDIEWTVEGTTLRGWLYLPDGGSGQVPGVVVQHGFSAVKEMHLDDYAEVFSAAGLACVVYDHPGFGASDPAPHTPAFEIDPWQQVRFLQHAITYAQSRPEIDAERIGVWGSSYGAANAYMVGAIDKRVRAVVGQVPAISGSRHFGNLVRIDQWAPTEAMFAADRQARLAGEEPTMIPVVTDDPAGVAALPTPDSYEWFTTTSDKRAPAWRNQVTLRTLEMLRTCEPGFFVPLISPTPLLMVVAPNDRLVDGTLAAAAYNTALEPKRVVVVDGGHFAAYTGPGFEQTSAEARDWFVRHLGA